MHIFLNESNCINCRLPFDANRPSKSNAITNGTSQNTADTSGTSDASKMSVTNASAMVDTKVAVADVKAESGDGKPLKSSAYGDGDDDADTDEKKPLATADVKEEPNEKEPKAKEEVIPYEWAAEPMRDYVSGVIENSAKMELFFCMLEKSIFLGDRMLIFSQSLLTLNLIERFLHVNPTKAGDGSIVRWAKNYTYFRKYNSVWIVFCYG